MSLEKIAHELYGLPLDEFVAARDQQAAVARKEKDRALANALKALVKPSVGAWAVNQLVRKSGPAVRRLLDLGDSMRQAQIQLDGDAMRQLTAERRHLLSELTEALRTLQISDTAENEALETLNAAVAEADLADQVRQAQLSRPLHHSGFGGMESMLASNLFATPKAPATEAASQPEPQPPEAPAAPVASSPLMEAPDQPEANDHQPEAAPNTPAGASKLAPQDDPSPAAPEPTSRRDDKSPQLKRLQRRLELAQETLEEARSDRDLARERVDSLRERLQTAKDKLKDAEQSVRAAEEECEDIQEQLDDL